jgi:hypothetical protein
MSFKNYTRILPVGVSFLFLFLGVLGFAQPITETFSSAGSFTYTIPAGYTATLTVEVWGGGGGGGTGSNAAGGGGGGAYARSQFLNAPAGSYTVVVGAGGIGAGTNITGAGGASSFSGTGITTVTAAGGSRGGDNNGGAGGVLGSSGNQENFSGGNGGNRNGSGGSGGGGGSAASAISNGNNGGNGTGSGAGGAGGVLTGAGSGGRGSDRDGTPDADPGAQPGGGGGGRGRVDNVSTSKNGGVGRVVVTVSNVLPITLATFQARSEEGGAMITWKVTSEINNDKMLVLRSKDGLNFQEIGQVNGRGTSTVPFEYRYFDANPGGGETYYRLKQVDFDGTFEYSKIIVLNTEGFIKLFIYPNPARERVFVKTTQDVIDQGLHLYDALGRKHNLQWLGGAGLYEATLPPQLTPGLYLISDPKGENKGKLLVQ